MTRWGLRPQTPKPYAKGCQRLAFGGGRAVAIPPPGDVAVILAAGDEVAIIAPAAQAPESEASLLEGAGEVLLGWGLRVRIMAERAGHFYLAGTDRARAGHLRQALAEPRIRAIFAARGGYGSMRLFAHLHRQPPEVVKFLVGYSDITALHLAAPGLWPGVESIHGPNIATRQFLGPEAEANRASLRSALFDPEYEVDVAVETLRSGEASGPLQGGCLSLLAAALGSRFSLRTEGAILFLEDTDEAPYRVDRLLVQLRNAGSFEGVAGVVFGVMPDCTDGINDLRDIIRDVLADYSFPIAFGLAAGHGARNLALPLGHPATLDGARSRFRLRRAG